VKRAHSLQTLPRLRHGLIRRLPGPTFNATISLDQTPLPLLWACLTQASLFFSLTGNFHRFHFESGHPMLTLHHLETSRSQRVLWLLEELQVPYEIVRYRRDPKTHLAPPELKAIHPLGKSPIITDGDVTVAESAAILEYIVDKYGSLGKGDVATLQPAAGTQEYRECRYWMHFAEGSLMNWLVMKLVFMTIPTQPMPFFVRPVARALCGTVQTKLIDPNVATALEFIDHHLATRRWIAGDKLTTADFQMSFAIEASLARGAGAAKYLNLARYRDAIVQRPAYRRGIEVGGPVVMS
jgi:glutathione S-transferase